MQSLLGRMMPDLSLPSTDGRCVNPARLANRCVLFFYPYTGQPGIADPPGWDTIEGAHGSTPQARSFSKLYAAFRNLDVNVYGVSLQSTLWQRECVTRNHLAYPLLSDEKRALTTALELETFTAGDREFLRRRTICIYKAIIIHDVSHIPQPAENAHIMLKMLSA